MIGWGREDVERQLRDGVGQRSIVWQCNIAHSIHMTCWSGWQSDSACNGGPAAWCWVSRCGDSSDVTLSIYIPVSPPLAAIVRTQHNHVSFVTDSAVIMGSLISVSRAAGDGQSIDSGQSTFVVPR